MDNMDNMDKKESCGCNIDKSEKGEGCGCGSKKKCSCGKKALAVLVLLIVIGAIVYTKMSCSSCCADKTCPVETTPTK